VIRVGERSSDSIRHVHVMEVIDGSTQHGGYLACVGDMESWTRPSH
jgi:hypothetical protein